MILNNYKNNILNYSIIISLFTQCNLNCKFCFQNHSSKLSQAELYKILQSLDIVIKQLNQNNIQNVYICLWGGQLFNDKYQNFYLYIYKKFIQQLKIKIYSFTKVKNIYITCLSNGIFQKNDRILKFLDQTKINIGFSYDPVYRYNSKKQYNILLNNINIFKKYLSGISITLTKPNIQYFINNNDKILKLDNINVNFYYPNKNWKLFLPSDKDLYNFFIYCINKKLYNIDYIKLLVLSIFNQNIKFCDCKYIIQYSNNQWTHNCVKRLSTLNQQNFYGKQLQRVTQKNCIDIKNNIAILKRNCLLCKYYTNCIMLCSGITIFKENKISQQFCPLKQCYEYLIENKQQYEDILKYNK